MLDPRASSMHRCVMEGRVSITAEDVARFQDVGYLVLRGALTSAEVRQLSDEADATTARGPLRPDQERHETLDAPLHTLQTPFASGLATDERIRGVAEAVFGDCFGLGCGANRYAGNTRWHCDHFPEVREDAQACAVGAYLEPLTAVTGAFRVIPRSHREPYFSDLQEKLLAMRFPIPDERCFCAQGGGRLCMVNPPSTANHGVRFTPGAEERTGLCASVPLDELTLAGIEYDVLETQPGDLIVRDGCLWHSAWGGSDDRRSVSWGFTADPKTTAAEAGTRDRARRSVAASTVGNGGTLFLEDWLARVRSPSHPGHAHWERWLSRAAELGFMGAVDESDAVQGKWYTYDPIAAKL